MSRWDYDKLEPVELDSGNGKSLYELGFTVVHPFFNEMERFNLQLSKWVQWSEKVKSTVHIVVVDDCSTPSLKSMLPMSMVKRLDLNLQIFRIVDDLKWNTPGALNLGITQAPTDWVFIMDSDCLLEPDMIEKLLNFRPNPDYLYTCLRDRITEDSAKKAIFRPPTCSLLFNKNQFNKVGGFDEDFTGTRSGGYGFFDWDFIVRFPEPRRVIKDIFISEYLEVVPSVQLRTNVSEDNLKINKRLFRAKQDKRIPTNKSILNFLWTLDVETSRS